MKYLLIAVHSILWYKYKRLGANATVLSLKPSTYFRTGHSVARMRNALLYFGLFVLMGCTSVEKPTIHLHTISLSDKKIRVVKQSFEAKGYRVVYGEQDFSHFLITPLIVAPKEMDLESQRIQQFIAESLGTFPMIKQGGFMNHTYSGKHIGVYLKGES